MNLPANLMITSTVLESLIQEAANEHINKWNNKSMFLPLSLSLKSINLKKFLNRYQALYYILLNLLIYLILMAI